MFQPSEILGVPVNADITAVKAAYKKLAKTNHPDILGNTPEANDRMAAISEAYETLTKGPAEAQAQAPVTPRRHTRPDVYSHSPFGNQRAQKRAEEADMADKEEMKRQETRWHAGEKRFQDSRAGGADDIKAAEAEVNQALSPEEKRTEMLKNLRQSRMTRNTGPTMYDSRTQTSKPIPKEAPAAPKHTGFEVRSGFGMKHHLEMPTTDMQDKALSEKLADVQQTQARAKVLSQRDGKPHEAPTAFHKAQKMSYEDGTIHIHLGSRGEAGKNIIVAPTFTQHGDKIRMGKDVQAFAMNLNTDGKQAHGGAEAMLIKNEGKMKVQVHFANEKQNLRAKQRQNDTSR